MNLYKIEIGNFGDDTNYCELVLSFAPLTLQSSELESICKIDHEWNRIVRVTKVTANDIKINAWTAQEYDKATEIINNLIK